MHARSYVFYRKGCFPTQPHRDSHFVRVILSPEHQLTLAPAQAQQFLSNNSSAFGFGSFAAQFPGMVLAQFTFHPRQLLLAERLAPHIPATPERLEPFLIYGFLPTASIRSSKRCLPAEYLPRFHVHPEAGPLASIAADVPGLRGNTQSWSKDRPGAAPLVLAGGRALG